MLKPPGIFLQVFSCVTDKNVYLHGQYFAQRPPPLVYTTLSLVKLCIVINEIKQLILSFDNTFSFRKVLVASPLHMQRQYTCYFPANGSTNPDIFFSLKEGKSSLKISGRQSLQQLGKKQTNSLTDKRFYRVIITLILRI